MSSAASASSAVPSPTFAARPLSRSTHGRWEFSQLIARFYGVAATAVEQRNGIVDAFVGDQVVALFIPGFAGADHAADAVATARELLTKTGHADGEPWIQVGACVHTDIAYVGAVGEGDAFDFTALGHSVNTAARLSSSASARRAPSAAPRRRRRSSIPPKARRERVTFGVAPRVSRPRVITL